MIRIASPPSPDPTGDVYDLEIACCGETVFVRRSHALMRRLEQAGGPLQPLAERLAVGNITQAEVARIYRLLLDEQRVGPTPEAIEAWVFEVGTAVAARAIATDVLSFVMGNQMLRRLTEAQRRETGAVAPEPGEDDQQRGPFSPVAE